MLSPTSTLLSPVNEFRIAILVMILGLTSLAQAAALIPFGSSTYADSLAITAIGAAGVLVNLGKKEKLVEYLQGALLIFALVLVAFM